MTPEREAQARRIINATVTIDADGEPSSPWTQLQAAGFLVTHPSSEPAAPPSTQDELLALIDDLVQITGHCTPTEGHSDPRGCDEHCWWPAPDGTHAPCPVARARVLRSTPVTRQP